MEEGKRLFVLAGIATGVFLVLRFLLPYVLPFLFAYLLVHMLNPILVKVRKRISWKKEVMISILLTVFLLVTLFVLGWFYRMLMEQIRRIALNFEYYYGSFCECIDHCCYLAEENLGMDVGAVKTFVYASLEEQAQRIRIYIVPNILDYSVKYLKKAVGAGAFLLMFFIAVILLAKDYDEICERLQGYVLYQRFHRITERMWKKGGMYLRAQGIIILVVIGLCTVGLWFLKNSYFLILGIGIGLLDALPFIGTGSALLPIALFLLLKGNSRQAAGYVILFLVTYVVREFLEPRLLGERLGFYPILMVAAVYAGICVYGMAGVVLGPVTLLLTQEVWKEVCGSV